MGCGKSTLGKPLARKLLYDFIDMDSYIERKENSTISELFKDRGEKQFRQIERECLEELSASDNIVIATGGGVASHLNNMEYMIKKGITIYLKMDSATLVSRLAISQVPRPLLQGKSREEMLETVNSMLIEREPFYNKAHIIINGKDIKVDDILEEIKKW